MAVDGAEFRRALGHFASGVTVVTAWAAEKQIAGITVSAFTSVSLDPPLVLVCLDRRASLHDVLKAGSLLAINFLAEDQEAISRRFASTVEDRFAGIGYELGAHGLPLLDHSLAALECRVVNIYDGGDHSIFVTEVLATRVTEGKPLVYYRGGYARLA